MREGLTAQPLREERVRPFQKALDVYDQGTLDLEMAETVASIAING
jgi:hypothetical protein